MAQLFNVLPEPWAANLFPERPLLFMNIPHPHTSFAYQHVNMPLFVLCSARTENDGKRWMHVSCSRRNRLPSWEELRLVKDTFIGRERKAIQVLPPDSEYVNIHGYVLHLWCCLDVDPLPDFRQAGMI